ncbi:MAG TPA: sulfotransferase, partial [Burkholderiales bacterium]
MSVGDVQARLQQGHAARTAGRIAEAIDHYRSAVEQEPGSAEANTVYGLMLLQAGRAGEAEAPLRKAIEIAPGHPAVRMNLAQWFVQQRRLDEAVGIVEKIVADEPGRHWAWERLGELKVLQGQFADAARHFRRATELQPRDPSLLFKLARASFDAGRPYDAQRILADAALLAPGNPAILRLQAEIHEARGDWSALEKTAQAWLTARPREPAAWRALARAQWGTGYLVQAMQNFQHALKLGERTAVHLATYARLCLSALDADAAGQALDEAEALDPGLGLMLSAKAVHRMMHGRREEAETYARRALAASPGDPFAYKTLSQVTEGGLSPAEAQALEALVDRADLRFAHRSTAAFALADYRDARGDFEGAFAAYEEANRLAHEESKIDDFNYDPVASTRTVDTMIGLFGEGSVRPIEEGEPRPVFIVGMPRSGTTLIESVIGAHSQALACGERMPLRWAMAELMSQTKAAPLASIDEATWAKWRATWWRHGLPALQGARVLTDKNPWNFDAIAAISRLFPAAKIIHVRRDPVETGLSIFRNQFSHLVRFTNRLVDIGHAYGGYARLMAHWERVAAGRFITIQYEDFVARFDEAARELIAYCGLEWEEGCARFWESRRGVLTISALQVRKPPSKASSRARAYAKHLDPLVNALKEAHVD